MIDSHVMLPDGRPDEELVLFPTWARREAGGGWVLPLHGRVYEPEEDSVLRSAALGLFRSWFGGDWSEAEGALFRARARLFLADDEQGKEVRVRAAGQEALLGPSGPGGHLVGRLWLGPAEPAGETGRPRWPPCSPRATPPV